jgi:hypothetical protein
MTFPACIADKIDNRNFAIDTYFPNANEIQLAERRVRRFWGKNATRFGPEPRYLAVEVSQLTSYPGIGPKLMFSETTTSWYAHGNHQGSFSELELTGIVIYDTKMGRFVSNQGYVSVDTPNRGGVARFGPYIARYIGTGR